jgi:hypothetical protein
MRDVCYVILSYQVLLCYACKRLIRGALCLLMLLCVVIHLFPPRH